MASRPWAAQGEPSPLEMMEMLGLPGVNWLRGHARGRGGPERRGQRGARGGLRGVRGRARVPHDDRPRPDAGTYNYMGAMAGASGHRCVHAALRTRRVHAVLRAVVPAATQGRRGHRRADGRVRRRHARQRVAQSACRRWGRRSPWTSTSSHDSCAILSGSSTATCRSTSAVRSWSRPPSGRGIFVMRRCTSRACRPGPVPSPT